MTNSANEPNFEKLTISEWLKNKKNMNEILTPNSKRTNYVLKTVPNKKQQQQHQRKTVVAVEINSNDNVNEDHAIVSINSTAPIVINSSSDSFDDDTGMAGATTSTPKKISKKRAPPNKNISKTPRRPANTKNTNPKPKGSTSKTSTTTTPKKERVMKDNSFHRYTLVRGLHSMIRLDKRNQLKQAIQSVVQSHSKSIILASRLAHVRITEIVQRAILDEERTGIRAENQPYIRDEFTPPAVINARGQEVHRGYIVERDMNPTKRTLRTPSVHNDPIHPNFKSYLDFYNVEIPYLPAGGGRCHDFARTQFSTCFHNNIRFHAYERIRNFFYTIFETIKQIRVRTKREKTMRKRLINNTLKYLFHVEPKTKKPKPDPLPIPDEDLLKEYRNILRPLLDRGVDRIPLGWLGATLRHKVKWYRHVHEMIRFQLWIYNENLGRDEKKQIRSFTVIPQYNFKQHFITIDTVAMGHIVNSFERGNEVIAPTDYHSSNVATRLGIWQKYFHLERLNKGHRYFDFTMKTDGVSAHFVMRNKNKIKSKRQILDENGDEIAPEITGYIDDRITRVITDDIREKYTNGRYKSIIGYDPGYKLPVAIVRQDILTGDETSYTMHWREFRNLCGDNERRLRRYKIAGKHERRHRNLRANREIYPEQPSNRSPDIWTYIDYQLRTFHRCCKVYMRRSMARMNFDAFISTQKALQQIAKIITQKTNNLNGNEQCILAVGDFKFSANSPIRGSVRCPMRSLFNLLAQQYGDVVEIDEYLTTQLCSICGSKMMKKGSGKDRYFICKNNMPADVILPRPQKWLSVVHKDRMREQFNRLPDDEQYIVLENGQRKRNELNVERENNVNPDFEATTINNNGKMVAKHGSIVWNRDINAPRNMIYKLTCMLDGDEISPVFNRPPPRLQEHDIDDIE